MDFLVNYMTDESLISATLPGDTMASVKALGNVKLSDHTPPFSIIVILVQKIIVAGHLKINHFSLSLFVCWLPVSQTEWYVMLQSLMNTRTSSSQKFDRPDLLKNSEPSLSMGSIQDNPEYSETARYNVSSPNTQPFLFKQNSVCFVF